MDHNEYREKTSRSVTAAMATPASSLPSTPAIIDEEDPFCSLTLIDPFHEISQSSKQAGRVAGRTASFRDGQQIGRTKGWEVGLELGYMLSFCSEILIGLKRHQQQQHQHDTNDASNDDDVGNNSDTLQKSSNRSQSRLDRCITLARDVVTLINEFPSPQYLLHNQHDVADKQQIDSLDISTSIQRIRVKFKLLSVLIKTGQSFDLRRILELKGDKDEGNDGVDHNTKIDSKELQKDNVASRKNIEHKSNDGRDW
jgi:hypothetical protein